MAGGGWNTHKIYLSAQLFRVQCPIHGIVIDKVPRARYSSCFTCDFEQQAAWIAVNVSQCATAQALRIAWNSVVLIISRIPTDVDHNPSARMDNLICIGVDEISYQKGHKYLTVVVKHDTGKVV